MATGDAPDGASARRLPHEFPRKILLAGLGLTPQRLTQTLYALVAPAHGHPPFVPTDIHVVTTTRGRDRARRELLAPETGRFIRFCADYRLDPRTITFDDEAFVVVERDGHPLHDITTPADHAAVAAAILRLVRRLTADADAAVRVSLAGGRRPLGMYLGHALSRYGRPQDRLNHVLVDAVRPADGSYYPPPPPAEIAIRGPRVNAADAGVTLVDVPFLRLQDELPLRAIDALPPYSPAQTDEPRSASPRALELHVRRRVLVVGGESVRLPPADFAFYALMAWRRMRGRDLVNARTPGLASEYLAEYERVAPDRWAPNIKRVQRRLQEGAEEKAVHKWFEQRKARVNGILRTALGTWLARPYLIAGEGDWGRTRFGLFVDPACITFHED